MTEEHQDFRSELVIEWIRGHKAWHEEHGSAEAAA